MPFKGRHSAVQPPGWPDFLIIIKYLAVTMKTCSIVSNFCQSRIKIVPWTICPRLLKNFQSGEISTNLVTLTTALKSHYITQTTCSWNAIQSHRKTLNVISAAKASCVFFGQANHLKDIFAKAQFSLLLTRMILYFCSFTATKNVNT